MTWWRITAPKLVAGLRVDNGVVREAAPILRWTVGRRWAAVKDRMRELGWNGEPF